MKETFRYAHVNNIIKLLYENSLFYTLKISNYVLLLLLINFLKSYKNVKSILIYNVQ